MKLVIHDDTETKEGLYEPVDAEMWYDRHYRHWVIYPIDCYGNQTREAVYGFSRREAKEIKANIIKEINNK